MSRSYHWTEAKVYQRLQTAYGSQGYVLLPQVGNATGGKRHRIADAVAISTWPSRGLYLTGFEIKVSRSDWRHELACPEKSTSLQKYCRYWYVVAPEGLLQEPEVPDMWGLIEAKSTGTVTYTRKAPQQEESPVDINLLCSVVRSLDNIMVPKCDVDDVVKARAQKLADTETQSLRYDLNDLKATVERFKQQSGVDITQRWSAGNVGQAVRLLMLSDTWNGAQLTKRLLHHLDMARANIVEALKECEIE